MTGFNGVFDNTVWDPIDHEQAIEDPLHGPSALASLAEIPPMPVGDGLSYKPGLFYETGYTAYVNEEGDPVYINEVGRSQHDIILESSLLSEWVAAYKNGTLAELRAERQQAAERMQAEKRGRFTRSIQQINFVHPTSQDFQSDKEPL